MLERLLGGLGKAEVEGAGEVLAPAIYASCGKQFFGADHAELHTEFVADEVLATVAACEREVGRFHVASAREPGDELGVLVVRVGADHEHAWRDVETRNGLAQDDCAALLRKTGGRGATSRTAIANALRIEYVFKWSDLRLPLASACGKCEHVGDDALLLHLVRL